MFANCGSSGYPTVLVAWYGDAFTPYTTGYYVFNNIFLNTTGTMYRAYDQLNSYALYSDFQHDYNNFYNNGSAIPTAGIADPNLEPHSTFTNPSLSMSGGTPTTWQGWVNYYRPNWNSASFTAAQGQGHQRGGERPAAGRAL